MQYYASPAKLITNASIWSGLLVLVARLLCCELALRVLDPVGVSYFFEIHRYSNDLQSDDRFAYIHRPNHRAVYQGVEVATNSAGFRGPELSPRKAYGTRRILVLGDSVVFGWGTPYEQTFPALLQSMLDRAGMVAEVIPAGVCSWNTRVEYEFLKARGFAYEPDVILLVIVDNDIEVKREGAVQVPRSLLEPAKQEEKSRWRNALEDAHRAARRNSYLWLYAELAWKRQLGEPAALPPSSESPAWLDARLALDGIVAESRARGIALVAVSYRAASLATPPPVLGLYEQRLHEHGVPTFALPDALFTGDLAYRNSQMDAHMNARGHRLVAERLWLDLAPWLATADEDFRTALRAKGLTAVGHDARIRNTATRPRISPRWWPIRPHRPDTTPSLSW